MSRKSFKEVKAFLQAQDYVGYDMNDYKTPGLVRCCSHGVNQMKNSPTNSQGILIVFDAWWTYQIYISGFEIFLRYCNADTKDWNIWKKIY